MSYTICRLKVILKKAKPPVWVQTEVPLGITFSALSVLLDLAAGEFLPLYGNAGDECPPPFEFESASENVQLREGIFEKDDRPVWNRDLREADTTFVDEYLTAGSWFTYRPDRSAERSYRVEVLDFFHSEYGMPMLGKYSRGADAYYGAQENWYQRRAMLAMRWRAVQEKDAHFRKKEELWEEVRKDPDRIFWPIPAMEAPKSRPDNRIRCSMSLIRESSDLLRGAFQEFLSESRDSLRECLAAAYKKEDLADLAKLLGIETAADVSVLTLARRCAEELLKREVMEPALLSVNDRQMETFRKALANGGILKTSSFAESDDLAAFSEREYAFHTKDEVWLIPADVREAFARIDTPLFQEARQQYVWLLDCLEIVPYYYGSIPLGQFYELYRQFGKLPLSEVRKAVSDIPEVDNPCRIMDGRVIAQGWIHDREYRKLEEAQGDKMYYLPLKEEVEDLSRNGYPTREKEAQALRALLQDLFEMDELDAEDLTEEIWYGVNQGESLGDVLDLINRKKLALPSQAALEKLVRAVTELNNHTHLLYNRGNTPRSLSPAEIARMRRNGGPLLVPGSSKMADFMRENAEEFRKRGIRFDPDAGAREIPAVTLSADRKKMTAGTKKIYPNDPCPCGSGKKYKKCCGR